MGDNNNPTPSTSPETSPAAPASRLIRRSPRPLALEQRFVFDGAAAAEVVEAGSSMPEPSAEAPAAATVDPLLAAYAAVDAHATSAGAPDAAPSSEPLFRLASGHAALGEAAELASSALQRYLQEASDAQLFELFNGGQAEADAQWLERLAALRAAIDSGELALPVRLLDNAQLQGALAAYAGEGPGGAATIFLNGDWLALLDTSRISQLLIEEYGHHIDRLLNPGADTPGDEGQRFAAAVTGADSSAPGFATDNDQRTLQIDGESIEVELAQLSFSNAYAVNVATTPAGKESNSHDFTFTSLGTATISDDTASHLFSGNDVAAIGISIGGEKYFGWISRPIKSGGVVQGFYFWTDNDFVDLATAQADGNADGDRNVADNRGFLLVVNQAFFDGLGWRDQAANLKNVGSSSDRVDSALNALIPGPVAPVAVADTAIAVEAGGASNATPGSNANGNLLDNDSDANGDTLTVTAVNGSAITAGGSVVVNGQYGQLTLGANGAYSYVVDNANAAVQALRSSANTLNETFTYRISDGNGGSATSTLSVTIQGANDNPTARHDYNVAKESLLSTGAYGAGDLLGSQATGNVLDNDSDPDRYGETLTVQGLSGSASITALATLPTTSTLYFAGDNGFKSVSAGRTLYLLIDGSYRAVYGANGQLVTITSITEVSTNNFDIVLSQTPASYDTNGVSGGDVAIADLSFFATNKSVGFKNSTEPTTTTSSMKTASVSETRSSGKSTVDLSSSSLDGVIAVGMQVTGDGVPPETRISKVTYDASGRPVSIELDQSITSSVGNTLSFSAAAGQTLTGQHGTLQLSADGRYTYTPTANNPALAAGQSAVEAFEYTVVDAAGASSRATLFITVLGSGSTDPNAVADSATATERGGVANASAGVNPSGNLLSNDSTPSGTSGLAISTIRGIGAAPADATSVTAAGIEINGLYGTLSLNNAGIYSYILDNDNPVVQALRDSSDRLSETFVYTVTNSSGMKDSATFTITVQGANDAPLASDDSAIAVEAGGINNSSAGYDPSGNVLSNDSDVDDLPSELRVTAVRTGGVEGAGSAGSLGNALAGSYGWLTLNANGNWTYVVDQSNAMVNALAPGETLTERFNYTVTDRSGSGLSDTAVLTITIQGARDSVAVNDVFVNEASPYAVFTVSGGVGVQVALALDTAGLPASDVRATLGTDVGSQIQYLDGSNWVAYDAGNPPSIPIGGQLLVRVAVLQDDVHEGNESFRLIATTSDGSQSAGIGTINDEGEGDVFLAGNTSGTPDSAALDDDRPTLSVANVSVSEGDPAEFVVSIDKAASTPISFSPVLASGTAIVGSDTAAASALQYHDGSDWVTVSGPVSIAAGELSVRLRIATVDDSEVEPDQTFSLSTGNVSGTVTNPLGASGTATIIDNDTPVAGAPELDLDANDSSTASGADYLTFFTENGSAVSIADSDLLIVDADSTNLASATIVLTNAKAGDSLDVGPLPTGISASIETSVAGQITVTLSGTASKANYQTALRAVTFSNSSDAPDTSDRLVVVKVSDGVNESNSALTTIRVVAVNDAPLLADTALSLSVAEDAGAPSGAVGSPLSAFTGGISDPDGDVPKGIAIVGSDETHGTWHYSTDGGSSWQSVGSVSATSALLLADTPNTRLYFQPADDFNGSIASGLTFKAWDQSSGTVGSRADTTPPTQADSYTSSEPVVIPSSGPADSSVTLTSSQTVSGLKGPVTGVTVTLNGLSHGWPQDLDILLVGPQGQKVLLMSDAGGGGGNAYSNLTLTFDDAAASALPGVGQPLSSGTFRPTDLTDGEGGDSFTGVSGPFASQLAEFIGTDPNGQWTLYISDDVVQFDGGSLTSWTLTLHTPIDGSAFSTASDSIAVTVTPINDAPLASGSASLAPVDEDDTDPPGASVSSLFTARFDDSTDQVTGGSSANSLAGIAITGYSADAGKGSWQYSTDGGTSWTSLGSIAGDASALTLDASALLRFLPAADYNGPAPDLSVRLLDSSTSVTSGATLDVSSNGGSTAISAQTVTLSTSVTAMPDPTTFSGDDSASVTEDSDDYVKTGTLLASDVDALDAVTFTALSNVAGHYGTFSIASNGQWTYSADNAKLQPLSTSAEATDSFTVTAADGTTHTIVITLNGVNDAATFSGDAAASVTEDSDDYVKTGTLLASDVDTLDAVTFTALSNVAGHYGTFSIASDGQWTYSADNAKLQPLSTHAEATDSFTVTAADGTTHTIVITLNGVNDPATFSGDATASVTEDSDDYVKTGTLLASDVDTLDAVTFTALSNVAGHYGTFSIGTDGQWTYSADNAKLQPLSTAAEATDSFTVTAADGTTQVITITLNGVNDPATFSGDATASVTEDSDDYVKTGTLLASDVDALDAVTFTALSNVAGHYGTFSIGTDGQWTYSADNAKLQPLSTHAEATDSFTVTAADGTTQVITITLNGVNDPATFSGDATASVTEDANVDGSGKLNASGSLTISDADSGEAAFRTGAADISAAPGTLGSLSLDASGAWTYSVANSAVQYLKAGETKLETFTVRALDGTEHTVNITIHGVNDAAVIAGNANGAVTEDADVDTEGNLTDSGQLTISDADSGEAAFRTGAADISAVPGTLGSLSLDANGAWTYSVANSAVQYLKAGETKLETFTVRALDGTEHTVSITIHGVNDAALIGGTNTGAVTEDANVDGNGKLNASGSLTISDADSGEATFRTGAADISAAPGTLGRLSLDANGAWTYSVANSAVQYLKAGETKLETFTVTALDGTTHQVQITIHGVNDAAVIAGNANGAVTEDANVDGSGKLKASGSLTIGDADSGEAAFRTGAADISAVPGTLGSLSLDASGTWTYSVANSAVQYLKAGETKLETFTVTALDGTTHQVSITIHGVNDAALIGGTNTGAVTEDANVDGNGKLNASGSLTISDADAGEAAFQTSVSAAADTLGSLSLDASCTWTYSVANSAVQYLKAGETKLETFTVTALDGTTHQVQVTINGVNDAALISGSSRGSVQEDTTLTSAGRLLVSDADSGQAAFVAQQDVAGSYGSFAIDAAGNWTYLLDNEARHVQRLTSSETVTERFVVRSLDGTEQVIEISVRGLDDVPPTPPQAPAPLAPPASEPPAAPSSPSPAAAPAPIVAGSPLQAPLADARPMLTTASTLADAADPMQRAALSDVYTSTTGFRVVVMEAPEPTLTLYRGMGDQYADGGAVSSFSIPYDAFVHTDPEARVVLSAVQASGERLPDWLVFNPLTGKFEVRAPEGFRGDVTVKVVARDDKGREVSTMFRISIGERQDSSGNAAGNSGRAGLSEQLRAAAKRASFAFGELPVGKPARSQVL